MIGIQGSRILPNEAGYPTLHEIGWGLARTGRFAGQTKRWYSVLPHVYCVAELVGSDAKIHALLHDAAEAVVGDQVSTWKNTLTEQSEAIVLDRIYHSLGLNPESRKANYDEVHAADLACRAAEARVLGHADPSLFDIPDREMYNQAVVHTTLHVEKFGPVACILETEDMARNFELAVKTEIDSMVMV